jgi:hypothetical protein
VIARLAAARPLHKAAAEVRMRSRMVIWVFLAGLFAIGCGAPDAPTDTTEEGLTGELNIDAWCKHVYGPSAWAGLQGNNAGSWVCVTPSSGTPHPDMQAVCRYQYGSNAVAQITDWSSPYAWYCVYGCSGNAECGAGNYCKKPNGSCGAVGVCSAVPTGLCVANALTCGCDGRTYYGPCFAAKASTNVKHFGACP